jgi:hypothetical protein
VLDLGAGRGALAEAVRDLNPSAKLTLIEFDRKLAGQLQKALPNNSIVLHEDALTTNNIPERYFDAVVTNPLYGTIELDNKTRPLIERSDLQVPIEGRWVRGDAAFVARAWELTRKGSSLGLIIAAPIIRDPQYKEMRNKLIKEMQNLCITQLHPSTFKNAEVQAFMVTGTRTVSRNRSVLLRKTDSTGTVVDELSIPSSMAINRMDFEYHYSIKQLGITDFTNAETLASIGVTIARGSRSQGEFIGMGLDAFHTTNFSKSGDEVALDGAYGDFRAAGRGDILIPRVGTRCLLRQARVVRGRGLFTDCIYRLTPPKGTHERVWKTLASNFGMEWRDIHASGNCAKHLTLSSVLGMPVIS